MPRTIALIGSVPSCAHSLYRVVIQDQFYDIDTIINSNYDCFPFITKHKISLVTFC